MISKFLTSKISKKISKFFSLKIVASLFLHDFVFSPITFRHQNTFSIEYTTAKIHFFGHKIWRNFEISDLKNLEKISKLFYAQNCCQLYKTHPRYQMEKIYCKKYRETIQCNKPSQTQKRAKEKSNIARQWRKWACEWDFTIFKIIISNSGSTWKIFLCQTWTI